MLVHSSIDVEGRYRFIKKLDLGKRWACELQHNKINKLIAILTSQLLRPRSEETSISVRPAPSRSIFLLRSWVIAWASMRQPFWLGHGAKTRVFWVWMLCGDFKTRCFF